MKTVLVIGSNSFSGQDFIDLLLDDPEIRVIGVSRSLERPKLFLKYRFRADLSRYRYFQIDLNREMGGLLQLLDAERPEYVVNFAAQSEVAPSWEHPEQWYETNCVALARLVNHLRKRDYLRRYLQISSPEVYGTCVGRVDGDAPLNPSTPYAASKAAADLFLFTYFKQFGFPLLVVRATNVYGARQQLFKIVPRSVIWLKLGRKIALHGAGRAIKSYIHIRDVSRGELAILQGGRTGQIYHLSPEQGIAVSKIVRLVCERLGRNFEEWTTSVDERLGQDAVYQIDSSRTCRELGWAPKVDLEKGLSEVITWIETNWDEIVKYPLEYRHKH